MLFVSMIILVDPVDDFRGVTMLKQLRQLPVPFKTPGYAPDYQGRSYVEVVEALPTPLKILATPLICAQIFVSDSLYLYLSSFCDKNNCVLYHCLIKSYV